MGEVLPEDKVTAIITKDVVTVEPSETIRTALNKMHVEDVGCIIVKKDGRPVGIITERDITRLAAKAEDANFLEAEVGTVMRKPLISVDPDTSIWDALEIMLSNDIRRLPIMKGDELSGIVTEKDIAVWILKIAYEPQIPEKLRRLIEKLQRQEKL
ncbi:MAG: CBS domain-containing protein [Candidatus Bathyarchaeia archaeon]